MQLIKMIINKTGELIYPITYPNINNKNVNNNQITLLFYNDIFTQIDGSVIGINPILTNLTGTITIQARSDIDSKWNDIEGSPLNIASDNMLFPLGVIQSIKAICNNVTGCNYIAILLNGGA